MSKRKRVASVVLNDFINDSRVLKEVRSLTAAGFEVTVVALKIGDVPKFEKREGFEVHRIDLKTRVLPKGKFFGAIKYLELTLRIIFGYANRDIWHCNDFEPFLMAAMTKIFKRKLQVVYDAHEYAREKNGRDGINKRFVNWMEPKIIHCADAVITVSEGIAKEYVRLYGLEKVHVVYNAPHKIQPIKADRFREAFGISPESKIFLYQGKFITGRGVQLLLDAFSELDGSGAVLVFLGSGYLENDISSAAGQVKNIFMHPAVSYEEIIAYSSSADFGLNSVENVCLSYYYCMPNKLFEYIQAGIPIVTTNLYDCKHLVEDEHIGLVIPEFTVQSVKETVLKAMKTETSQFEPGLKRAADIYHWAAEEAKFVAIYQDLSTRDGH
jgi:glycosyltransferase involved in cell wall biosynthesis